MARWILDGMFLALIGALGFVGQQAKERIVKIEDVAVKNETRIMAVELSNARIETKLDYLIKITDEIRGEMRIEIRDRK
jgi:hypothetical protein